MNFELLRYEDVAKLLCISRRTVFDLVESGKLKAVRVCARRPRVDRKDLEDYVAVNKTQLITDQHSGGVAL